LLHLQVLSEQELLLVLLLQGLVFREQLVLLAVLLQAVQRFLNRLQYPLG
jgi:hypothetical protein